MATSLISASMLIVIVLATSISFREALKDSNGHGNVNTIWTRRRRPVNTNVLTTLKTESFIECAARAAILREREWLELTFDWERGQCSIYSRDESGKECLSNGRDCVLVHEQLHSHGSNSPKSECQVKMSTTASSSAPPTTASSAPMPTQLASTSRSTVEMTTALLSATASKALSNGHVSTNAIPLMTSVAMASTTTDPSTTITLTLISNNASAATLAFPTPTLTASLVSESSDYQQNSSTLTSSSVFTVGNASHIELSSIATSSTHVSMATTTTTSSTLTTWALTDIFTTTTFAATPSVTMETTASLSHTKTHPYMSIMNMIPTTNTPDRTMSSTMSETLMTFKTTSSTEMLSIATATAKAMTDSTVTALPSPPANDTSTNAAIPTSSFTTPTVTSTSTVIAYTTSTNISNTIDTLANSTSSTTTAIFYPFANSLSSTSVTGITTLTTPTISYSTMSSTMSEALMIFKTTSSTEMLSIATVTSMQITYSSVTALTSPAANASANNTSTTAAIPTSSLTTPVVVTTSTVTTSTTTANISITINTSATSTLTSVITAATILTPSFYPDASIGTTVIIASAPTIADRTATMSKAMTLFKTTSTTDMPIITSTTAKLTTPSIVTGPSDIIGTVITAIPSTLAVTPTSTNTILTFHTTITTSTKITRSNTPDSPSTSNTTSEITTIISTITTSTVTLTIGPSTNSVAVAYPTALTLPSITVSSDATSTAYSSSLFVPSPLPNNPSTTFVTVQFTAATSTPTSSTVTTTPTSSSETTLSAASYAIPTKYLVVVSAAYASPSHTPSLDMPMTQRDTLTVVEAIHTTTALTLLITPDQSTMITTTAVKQASTSTPTLMTTSEMIGAINPFSSTFNQYKTSTPAPLSYFTTHTTFPTTRLMSTHSSTLSTNSMLESTFSWQLWTTHPILNSTLTSIRRSPGTPQTSFYYVNTTVTTATTTEDPLRMRFAVDVECDEPCIYNRTDYLRLKRAYMSRNRIHNTYVRFPVVKKSRDVTCNHSGCTGLLQWTDSHRCNRSSVDFDFSDFEPCIFAKANETLIAYFGNVTDRLLDTSMCYDGVRLVSVPDNQVFQYWKLCYLKDAPLLKKKPQPP